jgi:hypothetical protein
MSNALREETSQLKPPKRREHGIRMADLAPDVALSPPMTFPSSTRRGMSSETDSEVGSVAS